MSEVYDYKILIDSTLPKYGKYDVPRNVTKEY